MARLGMDDFQVAKLEFEAVVNNALEDSPSRQLARQKLQKVRSLRGGATASPLYHAVLEDMIGGSLGPAKKSSKSTAPRGHVLLQGRRVSKAELQGASLYKLARLWMADSPQPEEPPHSSIDVFNLPPLPPRSDNTPDKTPKADADKARAVEARMCDKRECTLSIEELRAETVLAAKRSRAQHVAELDAKEKGSARLLHLEARTNVSLRDK